MLEGTVLAGCNPAGPYRAFIRAAHARGIRCSAAELVTCTERYVLPRHQRKAVAMLQRVLDYNAARRRRTHASTA